LAEIEQTRKEKRGRISEGHQFLATGFADGTLFQYEYVNTGETFFYQQEPTNDAVIQETGLKWLNKLRDHELRGQPTCPKTLCVKGEEFGKAKQDPTQDKKQKTLDDYVTKSK
jgi:hypothetical protein